MNKFLPVACFLILCSSFYGQNAQDFFKVHQGKLPVKVYYGQAAKAMNLLGIDGSKGIIYAELQGAGRVQLELRALDKQNITRFEFEWPRDAVKNLRFLSDEQYDPRLLPLLRPVMYKLLLFLEIPQQYFPIHDACLTYVQSLVAMEQYGEAFYVLSRLKLSKLDEFGYREFSEASLELAGKMIAADAKSAKLSRALLQRVTIRDNTGDHAAYLKLADSLRSQGLYNEAISEYAGLVTHYEVGRQPIWGNPSDLADLLSQAQYSAAAAQDKRYQAYANKYFNTALQSPRNSTKSPREIVRRILPLQACPGFGAGSVCPPFRGCGIRDPGGRIIPAVGAGGDGRDRFQRVGLDWRVPHDGQTPTRNWNSTRPPETSTSRFRCFQINQMGRPKPKETVRAPRHGRRG